MTETVESSTATIPPPVAAHPVAIRLRGRPGIPPRPSRCSPPTASAWVPSRCRRRRRRRRGPRRPCRLRLRGVEFAPPAQRADIIAKVADLIDERGDDDSRPRLGRRRSHRPSAIKTRATRTGGAAGLRPPPPRLPVGGVPDGLSLPPASPVTRWARRRGHPRWESVPLFITCNKMGAALGGGLFAVLVPPRARDPADRQLDVAQLFIEAGSPAGGDLGGERRHRDRPRPSSPTPTSTRSPSPGPPPRARRSAPPAPNRSKRCSLELGGKSAAIVLEKMSTSRRTPSCCRPSLGLFNTGQARAAQTRIPAPRSRHDEIVAASFRWRRR